jgi:hypothetical protein
MCRTFVDLFMVNTKQNMCKTFLDLCMVNTKQTYLPLTLLTIRTAL